jgi:signal transduction histidine kinase
MYEPGQESSHRKHAVQETVKRRAIERRLGLAFALAIAVLVANAAVSTRATRVLIRNERGVAQALEVLNHLETTLSLMSDAETGQRGYLITGTEEYLASYDSALSRMTGELGRLQNVTASQPRQVERLALLQRTVATMEDEENALLVQHAAESGASARTAVRTFLISNLVAVVFLIVALYVVVREVTDRDRVELERAELLAREKVARADAETASCAKDGFLATVSHELRSPLNAIFGWTHLLSLGTLDGESTRRAVATIERNAKAQARLIDDLLDVSSIMSGRLRLHPEPVNLVTVIEAALEAARPAADAKSIELRSQLDSGGGGVMGDPTRLQQVVWNLLTNAVKFTDRGGRIQVTLEGGLPGANHIQRQWTRDRSGVSAPPLRALSAGRQQRYAASRRHGAWPVDRAQSCRDAHMRGPKTVCEPSRLDSRRTCRSRSNHPSWRSSSQTLLIARRSPRVCDGRHSLQGRAVSP